MIIKNTFLEETDILSKPLRMRSLSADGSMAALSSPVKPSPRTVMIRNVPNRMTLKSLSELIRSQGHEFEKISLPSDRPHSFNVGYGFVSFTSHESAAKFMREFNGTKLQLSLIHI